MITRYVAFASLHAQPLSIAARLRAPPGDGPHPAVIILHGAGGPSAREGHYAAALNRAGFVTLELDQASPRAGIDDAGPYAIHETLPDLFGARRFLAARAEVDASRIGVLGFAAGGAAALLAATAMVDQGFPADGGFAAFLAFCPACHQFNRTPGFELENLVPAPVLIATAARDEYDDDPDAGPALARTLPAMDRTKVRTAVFYGVGHGFDVPGPPRRIDDPAAHRGAGGQVAMTYDAEAAARAHEVAVLFFGEMQARRTSRRPSAAWG